MRQQQVFVSLNARRRPHSLAASLHLPAAERRLIYTVVATAAILVVTLTAVFEEVDADLTLAVGRACPVLLRLVSHRPRRVVVLLLALLRVLSATLLRPQAAHTRAPRLVLVGVADLVGHKEPRPWPVAVVQRPAVSRLRPLPAVRPPPDVDVAACSLGHP